MDNRWIQFDRDSVIELRRIFGRERVLYSDGIDLDKHGNQIYFEYIDIIFDDNTGVQISFIDKVFDIIRYHII